MEPQLVRGIVLNLITMLLSLSIHEYSHARVADALGDDTPRLQGRLTLSPMAHYDIFGTFLIPIVGAYLGGFAFIGWARPVETVPSNYTRKVTMRTGHMLVAAAGPLSNLLLAVVAAALLALALHLDPMILIRQDTLGALAFLLQAMLWVNIGLFVFNLIPLPPLDGSRLLPRSLDDLQQSVAPYSFIIILLVLNIPVLRSALFLPVGAISEALHWAFGLTVGGGI